MIAYLAGSIAASWIALMTITILASIMGVRVGLSTAALIVGAAAASSIMITAFVKSRIAGWLEGVMRGSVEESYSGLQEALATNSRGELDEDNLLLAWSLFKSLMDRIAPSSHRLYLAVYSGGLPIAVYPPDGLAMVVDGYDGVEGGPSIEVRGDEVYVNLDYMDYEILASSMEDGERLVDRTGYTITILYLIAKSLAEKLVTPNEAIAAYIAYKAIYKMVRQGIIEASEDALSHIPLERDEVKNLIREQVTRESV